MANKPRLTEKHYSGNGYYMLCSGVLRCDGKCCSCDELEKVVDRLGEYEDKAEQAIATVELPCKIGDFVWAIRSFKGHEQPQRGIVSDMLFTKDMKLQIVVKYVARGEWGRIVFATEKEAYAAIRERSGQ